MKFELEHKLIRDDAVGILSLRPIPDEQARRRQVVILHGLASSKERVLTGMYKMAQAGFDVTAIDLALHGDRIEAKNLGEMLDVNLLYTVRQIIYQTAEEIPSLCSELEIDMAGAGIVGISAGGFVAHVLATRTPKFKAMVAAISSPDWLRIDPSRTPDPQSPVGMELARTSPVNAPFEYPPTALLLLNNALDPTVAVVGSETLHERLQPIYLSQGIADRLSMTIYPDETHTYSDEMIAASVEWLTRHL